MVLKILLVTGILATATFLIVECRPISRNRRPWHNPASADRPQRDGLHKTGEEGRDEDEGLDYYSQDYQAWHSTSTSCSSSCINGVCKKSCQRCVNGECTTTNE